MFNRFKKKEVVQKRQITPQKVQEDIGDIEREAYHSPQVKKMYFTCRLCGGKRINKYSYALICTKCKDEVTNETFMQENYGDEFIKNSIKKHSKRLHKYCKEAVEHYVKLGITRPEREELQRHIDNTKGLKPYQIYN